MFAFDSSSCDVFGKYTVVYECLYNKQKIHVLDSFNIIVKNHDNINAIEVYGYVNDLDDQKLIEDCTIQIVDLNDNSIIYQTSSDYVGKWYSYIYPGNYNFIFTKDNYIAKNVRVQIGDENKEIQFNNISIEKSTNAISGNGLYKIEDVFTSKNDTGIEGINVIVYDALNVDNQLISTTTDKHGKWKLFLDDGSYILKIVLPSGIEKMFQMIVYNDGSKTINEMVQNSSEVILDNVDNGSGSNIISDYILDAHGTGIKNVLVEAYLYNSSDDSYSLIAKCITDDTGLFTLNLDSGKYKFKCSASGFNDKEQIINI
jgi:hypothetical protein